MSRFTDVLLSVLDKWVGSRLKFGSSSGLGSGNLIDPFSHPGTDTMMDQVTAHLAMGVAEMQNSPRSDRSYGMAIPPAPMETPVPTPTPAPNATVAVPVGEHRPLNVVAADLETAITELKDVLANPDQHFDEWMKTNSAMIIQMHKEAYNNFVAGKKQRIEELEREIGLAGASVTNQLADLRTRF